MGFNIVLVSRTESKLLDVEKELKALNSSVQTKVLVKDFNNNANIEFYAKIHEECSGLDISLVIANAGIFLPGPFHLQSGSEIQSMMDVDMYHVAMISKVFLPQLKKRYSESNY